MIKERLECNRRRTMGIMIGFGPDGKNWRPWRLDQDEGHLVALLSFISPVETLPWTISRSFHQRIDASLDDRIDFIISRPPSPHNFQSIFFLFLSATSLQCILIPSYIDSSMYIDEYNIKLLPKSDKKRKRNV